MYLKSFSHKGIRNLTQGGLQLGKGLNMFYGDNGAGKSSVLEAIGFLASGRSFRTTKLDLIITKNESEFIVFGESDSHQKLGVMYTKKDKSKQIKVNGEKVSTLSSLSKLYPTQILSPESYHLIDSGPLERRKYLDWCLFHVKHQYHQCWKNYSNILKHRNALLKLSSKRNIKEEIISWNEQLLSAATLLNNERKAILVQLEKHLNEIMSKLHLDFCESLSLGYYPGFTGELSEKLSSSFDYDCASGFTKFGPHKADLKIKVNGVLAKDFLSRGQKKVLINAMFLSQTLLLKSLTARNSLFIIDDFTSELDDENQKALLTMLLEQKNVQIILSCLEQDSLKWLKKRYNSAHMFHVEHGEITPILHTESHRNNLEKGRSLND